MDKIKPVLEGIYSNESLRSRVVPLFMGFPGLAKTTIITEFAKEKGVHLELFLTSSKSPFEIDGIGIPNLDRTTASHVEFENILKLKDGDILFFDELPNGNINTLNACLTFIESRITAAGRKLPNIMIVGAGNYQGISPMTPQIKRRFKWYDIKFNESMWKDYMAKKYYLPRNISSKLCDLIKNEDFTGYNFFDPASIDKDVEMIISNVFTPTESAIKPILETLVKNPFNEDVKNDRGEIILNTNEHIKWLDLVRLGKNIIIPEIESKNKIVKENEYEIEMFDKDMNKIGEIKDIETLKTIYYLSDEDIENIKKGILTSPLPRPSPNPHFISAKNK